jgi:hypothetical protein
VIEYVRRFSLSLSNMTSRVLDASTGPEGRVKLLKRVIA